ncbi:hypothetical protein KW805_01715 [Candidatus Pacearchaeota archaeon]|nr:hypothetical protein [Candidatus Pacearchaeota archaeon]
MKKAQAWGMDLMIAGIIFITAIIALYLYSLNYSNEGEEILKELQSDGETMASLLLSEGAPVDWNITSVIVPGISSANKINDTKLGYLYTLSVNNYTRTQLMLNTKYNYFIFFSTPMVIQGNTVSGIGMNTSSPSNLITITHYTSYQNKLATMYVQLWN